MKLLKQTALLLRITRSHGIIRRYFVVNGFDGALTMLGLIVGFIFGDPANLPVIINACLGAAIALGVSGVSSAYVSETAERKHELAKLERAMVTDLQDSTHGDAARWIPMLVALVNGSAPFIMSLLIISPLWLTDHGLSLPISPLYLSVVIALMLIFSLGVVLGRIADISYIRSGLQTVVVALVTVILIYLFVGG